MVEFVQGIGSVLTTIFEVILSAFSSIGSLVFEIGEGGAISGVAPFGWLLVVIIGVPLATWLFTKAVDFVKRIGSKK